MKFILKKFIPCLLILSCLIGSTYCYLSAKKKDIKTIDIGDVAIDIEDDWYDSDGNLVGDDDNNGIIDDYENITLSTVMDKNIAIKNTGDHGAWVFVAVGTPYVARVESQSLADTAVNDIKVKAVAVQDNFKGFDDIEKVWSYFEDIETLLGDSVSASTTNVANIFEFGNDTLWNNNCGATWTSMETYRTSDYYWYVFGYNTTIQPEEETEPVFTRVRLNQKLGQFDQVSVSQYICISVDDACEMLRDGYLYGYTRNNLLSAKIYYYYNNAVIAASYQTLKNILIQDSDGSYNSEFVYNFTTKTTDSDGSVNRTFTNIASSVADEDGDVTYTANTIHSYKLFIVLSYASTQKVSKGADIDTSILNNNSSHADLPYQELSENFDTSDSVIAAKTDEQKACLTQYAAKLTAAHSTTSLNEKLHSNATTSSYQMYILATL